MVPNRVPTWHGIHAGDLPSAPNSTDVATDLIGITPSLLPALLFLPTPFLTYLWIVLPCFPGALSWGPKLVTPDVAQVTCI